MKIIIGDDFFLGSLQPPNMTCTMYFDFVDQIFPDIEWTDFPLIILSWWIRDIISNRHNDHAKFQMYFMDGSFRVNCEKELEKIHMKCVNFDDPADKIEVEKTVDFREFMRELRNAATRLIWWIDQANLGELRDYNTLKGYLKELNDVIKKEGWLR